MSELKVGFIGVGNMAQAMIARLIESKTLQPSQILASNRSEPRLMKAKSTYGIQPLKTNEEVIDASDVVFLSMKPQDLMQAVEPLGPAFRAGQIVVSLAAGIRTEQLRKVMVNGPVVVRVMPNTPSKIGKGVIGLCYSPARVDVDYKLKKLLEPMGKIITAEDEDQLQAILVGSAAGTGFVFELMIYWQDWLEEHKFSPADAREITVQTFVGTALLAAEQTGISLEDLQARVVSKKGVTDAGLASIRENEIERGLRISFEKAAMRDDELSRKV